jgi:hypothetical protein
VSETLSSLIKRVEEATGPDRELDLLIYRATTKEGSVEEKIAAMRDSLGREPSDAAKSLYRDSERNFSPPRYTASIDAALTLVPEGWDASIHRQEASAPKAVCCGAVLRNPGRKDEPVFSVWDKPTPALALVAAALKARAQ